MSVNGTSPPAPSFLGKVFSPVTNLYRSSSPQNFPLGESKEAVQTPTTHVETLSNTSFSSQRSVPNTSFHSSGTGAVSSWKGASTSSGGPSEHNPLQPASSEVHTLEQRDDRNPITPPARTRGMKAPATVTTVPSSAATPPPLETTSKEKPVENACATHVNGYRKCLEVNPDAKMNCTWALDNYIKCQETSIQ